MKGRETLSVLLASLFALPAVAAIRTGISPLDDALVLVSGFFNVPSLQNPAVAVGVARFAFFIAIFSLLNWSARKFLFREDKGGGWAGGKSLDKKTANIVAAALAIISAFLVPGDVILASASGYAGLIWILITTGPAIAAFALAYFPAKWKQEKQMTAGFRVFELIILLLGFAWTWFMVQVVVLWIGTTFPSNISLFVDTFNSWMYIVMFFAVIVKIFQALFAIGGGGDGGGGGSVSEKLDGLKDAIKSGNELLGKPFGAPPPDVPAATFERAGNDRVKVKWEYSDSSDLQRFEIDSSLFRGGESKFSKKSRRFASQNDREITLNTVFFGRDEYLISEQNDPVMQFRVRAVDKTGKPGKHWTYTQKKRLSELGEGGETEPLPEGEQDREREQQRDGATPADIASKVEALREQREQLEEKIKAVEQGYNELSQERHKVLITGAKIPAQAQLQNMPIINPRHLQAINRIRQEFKQKCIDALDQHKSLQDDVKEVLQGEGFGGLEDAQQRAVLDIALSELHKQYARLMDAFRKYHEISPLAPGEVQ